MGVGGNQGQDQEQGSIKPGAFARALPLRNRAAAAFWTFFLPSSLSTPPNMSTNQPASTDPTKMGVGRSIAVLTSGGDAQGEARSGLWCLTAD